jgi:hypothetical protein
MAPADILERLSTLEREVQQLEELPQDTIGSSSTIFLNEKGETVTEIFHEDMFWEGPWADEPPYERGAVVRYKSATYVCIENVPAFVRKLGPGITALVGSKEHPAGLHYAPRGQLTPFVPQGGIVKASNPFYPVWGTEEHVQLWQFEAVPGSKITVPNPGGGCHIDVYNSDLEEGNNKRIFGNFAELKNVEVKSLGSHVFYLAVYNFEKKHIPATYLVELSGTALAEAPGNAPPPEDTAHWAVVAEKPLTGLPEGGFRGEVLTREGPGELAWGPPLPFATFGYTFQTRGEVLKREQPGSGEFCTQPASPAPTLYFNDTSANGETIGNALSLAVKQGSLIRFYELEEPRTFWVFKITGAVEEKEGGKVYAVPVKELTEQSYPVEGEPKAVAVSFVLTGVSEWVEGARNAKVEELVQVRVRTEQFSATARLRGILKVKAGEEIAPNGTIYALPESGTGLEAKPIREQKVPIYCAAIALKESVQISSSVTVTEVKGFANLKPGDEVSGTGIPAGTIVVAVNQAKSEVTLSKAATKTEKSTLTFTEKFMNLASITTGGQIKVATRCPAESLIYLEGLVYSLN